VDEETTQDRESPAGCPSQAELVAFNRGRLPAQRTDSVAIHIGICQPCEAALRELSDDSDLLIASLRGSCTDELPFVQEPGCARLEGRAWALFSGSSDARKQPPQRLGQYELVRRIKGGGMGDVHEARHVRLERRVALKTLRGDRMHDPRLIARFQREMAAVGKVDHPNVVRASDAGDAEGWHFLVMDFIDGLDLAVIARRCGALPTADAAEIARQAALGLQSIHEHGLVHRDIKPSNLMLDVDGNVKILDLGLALLYEAPAPGDDLTETGVGMGTADYMSPEQALDSHQVKIQSDLYSLGCTLYKLLTGRAPFETPQYRTPLKKMKAHVQDLPPPVQTYLPNIPAGLGDIVHQLLEKKANRRFATPPTIWRWRWRRLPRDALCRRCWSTRGRWRR
jgi:serine/threonine protein kinase